MPRGATNQASREDHSQHLLLIYYSLVLAPYKQHAVCAPWEAIIGMAMQLADCLPETAVAVLASAEHAMGCVPTSTDEPSRCCLPLSHHSRQPSL